MTVSFPEFQSSLGEGLGGWQLSMCPPPSTCPGVRCGAFQALEAGWEHRVSSGKGHALLDWSRWAWVQLLTHQRPYREEGCPEGCGLFSQLQGCDPY
jgi:hypothetical protein